MSWFKKKHRAIIIIVAAVMLAGGAVGILWSIAHPIDAGQRIEQEDASRPSD